MHLGFGLTVRTLICKSVFFLFISPEVPIVLLLIHQRGMDGIQHLEEEEETQTS